MSKNIQHVHYFLLHQYTHTLISQFCVTCQLEQLPRDLAKRLKDLGSKNLFNHCNSSISWGRKNILHALN